MSYDLYVYGDEAGPEALQAAALVTGLAAEDDGLAEGSPFVVVRGARRRYSFTVEPPERVEPEDVPDEITAVLLGATSQVLVRVEGSEASEVPHAIRAARRIALAMRGAVHDVQTDEVHRRGSTRRATPARGAIVATLAINWWVRTEGLDLPSTAETFFELARRHLPDALPRRYGRTEPLQHQWEPGRAEAFLIHLDEDEPGDAGTSWTGSGPVAYGSISSSGWEGAVVASHGLTILADALADVRYREAVVRFFTAVASQVDAVYASASVLHGAEWSGRQLWYPVSAEYEPGLGRRGVWKGLPPTPKWLSWFGTDYADEIGPHLSFGSVRRHDRSLFHRAADEPTDQADLARLLTPPTPLGQRRWFGLRGPRQRSVPEPIPWLPVEYLAITSRTDPTTYPIAEPAAKLPRTLQA